MRFFPKLELARARPKMSLHAKNQLWGLPVCSINSVHINIYIADSKKWLFSFGNIVPTRNFCLLK